MNVLKKGVLSLMTAAMLLSAVSCTVPFFDSAGPEVTAAAGETSAVTVTSPAETAASVSQETAVTSETVTDAVSAPAATTAITSSAADESRTEYEFSIPEYTGSETVELNGGRPCFSVEDMTAEERIVFSGLDELGRCGATFCCVGKGLLPAEERGAIGMVKPAGWHTVKYRNVDGKYLYNRCHLIAFELCGVNADERNLITGTRWLNIEGMLPTENRIRSFAEKTGIHVLYRVTPRYEGDELLARGVEMEALSLEDGGKGICLHQFCFNVQPGIVIDWLTGESYPLDPEDANVEEDSSLAAEDSSSTPYIPPEGVTYILNINSHRFHRPDCKGVQDMKPKNRKEYTGTREVLTELGYKPCGTCKP